MKASEETRNSLTQFRDEIARRFLAFSDILDTSHLSLEKSIEENVAALAGLDESVAVLRRIHRKTPIAETTPTVPQPSLPSLGPRESRTEFKDETAQHLAALTESIGDSRRIDTAQRLAALTESLEESRKKILAMFRRRLPAHGQQAGETFEQFGRRVFASANSSF